MSAFIFIGISLVAATVLWGLFLMYCALHSSMKSGKLYQTPLYVRWMSYVLLGVMASFDVLFNVTIGTVLFLEWPTIRKPTFTQRCSSHLQEEGRRGELARWVCNGWLNPFEEGHCR